MPFSHSTGTYQEELAGTQKRGAEVAGIVTLLDVIKKCAPTPEERGAAAYRLIYLSTPVTSTLRYRLDNGIDGSPLPFEVQAEIKEKNRKAAKDTAEMWEAKRTGRFPTPIKVINPFPLYVPEWEQGDYMRLWTFIIQRYISEMVMNPDWEYSAGCVEEYLVACDSGILCYDACGNLITKEQGRDLIRAAALRALENGHEDSMLFSVLAMRGMSRVGSCYF